MKVKRRQPNQPRLIRLNPSINKCALKREVTGLAMRTIYPPKKSSKRRPRRHSP
jgi:hypothetical protein